MLLSKTCVYGIRAVLYVATISDKAYVPIREISNELNISFHFLTKILQQLTQNGILLSFRGPNGGVTLARPGTNIRLLDIITTLDGDGIFRECILHLPGCGEEKPCPMHDSWDKERELIKVDFKNTTVEQMAKKIKQFDLRISGNENNTFLKSNSNLNNSQL